MKSSGAQPLMFKLLNEWGNMQAVFKKISWCSFSLPRPQIQPGFAYTKTESYENREKASLNKSL